MSHWLGAYLDWSPLYRSCWSWHVGHVDHTAFSHSNEQCSPYFLVITHQTQARDDIDGLMQERRKSIANALEYVFLAPSHPYKECHLWVPPPLIISSFNAMKSIWQRLNFFCFFSFLILSMYWAYHIILYRDISIVPFCDCQFWDTQPLPPLPILTLIYWSQADAVQSLNVVPSICHWYCVTLTLVCLALIISRWWGWTNM